MAHARGRDAPARRLVHRHPPAGGERRAHRIPRTRRGDPCDPEASSLHSRAMTAALQLISRDGGTITDAITKARIAANAAADKKGADTLVLEVGSIMGIVEHFVV